MIHPKTPPTTPRTLFWHINSAVPKWKNSKKMLKFCNVSDIAQYGPKSEIFVDLIYLNLYLYLSIKLPRPPPPVLVFLWIKCWPIIFFWKMNHWCVKQILHLVPSKNLLLFYQFTFAQNRPKSDISGALRPIHYITLKGFGG